MAANLLFNPSAPHFRAPEALLLAAWLLACALNVSAYQSVQPLAVMMIAFGPGVLRSSSFILTT